MHNTKNNISENCLTISNYLTVHSNKNKTTKLDLNKFLDVKCSRFHEYTYKTQPQVIKFTFKYMQWFKVKTKYYQHITFLY